MRDRTRTTAAVTAALALSIVSASAAVAAPDNDERVTATAVTSLPFTEVVDATDAGANDEDAADCGPVDRTVWYRIELDRGTDVLVDTAGSTYDTVVDVYSEAGATITCLDDTATTQQARLAFTARLGESYYVRVGRATSGDGGVEEPRSAAQDDEPTILHVSFEETRLRYQGRPMRSTAWQRGGTAVVQHVVVDEPDDWQMHAFVLHHGRSDARVHDDLDLTSWRHWVDHDKQVELIEHWDAFGSPGDLAIDQRLTSAHAHGHVWLQGLQCSYPLDEGQQELAALDEAPEEEDCVVLGGEWVQVDVAFEGAGATERVGPTVERFRGEGVFHLLLEQGTERQAIAGGTVGGELHPYRIDEQPGWMARGHYRSMGWSRDGLAP
jgi:hypothetical protein